LEILVNGQPHEVPEAITIAELLARFGLAEKYVAVEVNRDVIPRARHGEYRIQAGDCLEIVTLVGGG